MPRLPEGFEPHEHSRGRIADHVTVSRENLAEGVNVLWEDEEAGVHVLAQVRQGRIRCWHCYRSRDGGYNCFEIPCPF